jgi:hypothetical protein
LAILGTQIRKARAPAKTRAFGVTQLKIVSEKSKDWLNRVQEWNIRRFCGNPSPNWQDLPEPLHAFDNDLCGDHVSVASSE